MALHAADRPGQVPGLGVSRLGVSRLDRGGGSEEQRCVCAAKAEGVGDRSLGACRKRLGDEGHEVPDKLGVWPLEVERRRGHAVAEGQDREDRLDCAGRAEQVPGRALCGRHPEALRVRRVRPKELRNRLLLDVVPSGRGGRMRVDVADVARREPGLIDRPLHRQQRASPCWARRGDVVRVAREAVAPHLGVHRCAARRRVLKLLEHHDARAFPDGEPVSLRVERPRGSVRLVVEPVLLSRNLREGRALEGGGSAPQARVREAGRAAEPPDPVERARSLEKPPMETASMAASVPPATITSAAPDRMRLKASPME
mmetsp:Transcript_12336/g.29295  ORF Transcript_12336/g.29295 Transcript_12336/m.29295 type:complete len:314 (+) Transcript_12336:118-1059(+)